MKNKKLYGFSYVKSMANFEAFDWNFSSSTNPQIVRSGLTGWRRMEWQGAPLEELLASKLVLHSNEPCCWLLNWLLIKEDQVAQSLISGWCWVMANCQRGGMCYWLAPNEMSNYVGPCPILFAELSLIIHTLPEEKLHHANLRRGSNLSEKLSLKWITF